MLPAEMLGASGALSEATLIDKFCAVLNACGDKGLVGGYANEAKHGEVVAMVARAMASLDADANGYLSLEEITPVVGTSDGRLSLASLDPGTGSVLSFGTLWNLFIAGLVAFFINSIVEQVGLQTQQAKDSAELEALEASLSGKAKPAKAKQA